MERLPSDILQDIASRVPYETMLNCKLVCKPWRHVLSFIKVGLLYQFGMRPFYKFFHGDIDMHGNCPYSSLVEINNYNRAAIEQEPPLFDEMVGSCNGLVCFREKSSSAYDPIYICNPITKEYLYLPTSNYDIDIKTRSGVFRGGFSNQREFMRQFGYQRGFGIFKSGFGYQRSTGEYKVVEIFKNYVNPNNDNESRVQVYTLGSGHGWRDKGTIDHDLSYSKPGVCANGALHWIESFKHKIVAFDLADEEFRLIPLPPGIPQIEAYNVDTVYLKLLGECLCVVHFQLEMGRDFVIHIWALEKEEEISSHDMKEHEHNWRKKFSIPVPKGMIYEPLAVMMITKNNQVLMSYVGSVYCYDSETRIVRKLWDDSQRMITGAIPHVKSLVSLEALGEKSKRRR